MSSGQITADEVLAVWENAGTTREPLTASEIAEELGCSSRAAASELDELVERGDLGSKTVGERGRVWWRPVDRDSSADGAPARSRSDDVLETSAVTLEGPPSDATEYERLETELAEVFGRISDAFYALDAKWQFTHVNERAEELIDYQDEGLVGKDFWEVFEWATDSKLGEEYRIAMETQEPTSFEFYYPEPLEAWYEVHAYPSETGLSVYFRDITDRKERERELEEYRSRYQSLVENFPNGAVALVNEDLRYITFGGTPESIVDVTRADLEGASLRDALPQELADVVVPRYEAALDGETATFETTVGDRVYQFHFAPVRDDDGDVFAALGMSQDVTDRKRLETELEESERRYRTLAEYFPNGIVTLFDHDLEYTLAAGRGFGDIPVDPEDVEGEPFREVWPEDTADALEPTFEAVLDGEQRSVELEYAGREWVIHSVPITDERGDVFAGMTMAQDITEQKEREQRLEETVEKLEQSNERLESFAGMLAHELRNPVTIGQMYCHELPDEANSNAVEHVREAFDRVDAMIDVMLALTRGHEAVGERTTVSLADVAREAWDQVETPDATVDIDVDRTIQADETYIRHLFQNLFENAVEHGGTDVSVTVGELPTGFYVADDGPGIPADDRDAVFEAGFTTAAEKGGTGVGLAFVQKLTEVYEWESRAIESAAGGARFEFTNVDQETPRD
ncbi:hypothetical protein DMJ13_06985 [halophilic archaeon]|nr:hypothetical protein DMJ13_06985 [halophilic archaeon]